MVTSKKYSLPHCLRKSAAFTLVELLTVVAIIAILSAILIPVVGNIREKSNAAKSSSNLRQIGNGLAIIVAEGAPGVPPGFYPCYAGTDNSWANYTVHDLIGEKLGMARKDGNKYVWVENADTSVFQNPAYEVEYDRSAHGQTSSYGYNYVQLGTQWKHANHDHGIWKNKDDAKTPDNQSNFSNADMENPSNLVVFAETDGDGVADNQVWPYWSAAGVNGNYDGGGHYFFADGHVEWMDKEVVMANLGRYFRRDGGN
ncbi:MAG: prepilin-type N-terminal cleavage/methylation domain-containing protein [Verrucomicrobiota bacterium]